jgi:hypothetical protein
MRAVLEGRLGLTDRIEIGLEGPLLMHTAGFMDAPIDSYHSWLGLPDGGREAFARDQYVVGYSDEGRTVFLEEAPSGTRLGDVVISGRTTMARSAAGRSALALALALKLPTGSVERFDGSGHADLALGTWSLDPGLDLDDRRSLYFSWAFSATPTSFVVVQILGGAGPFPSRSDGTLGEPAAEIAAGMRHAGRSPWTIEWAFLENLTRDLNVPDVGFFFGVSRRFSLRNGSGS